MTATTPEGGPAAAGRPARQGARLRRAVGPAAVFGLFLAFWYFFHYVMLKPRRRFLLPTPHVVLYRAFWWQAKPRGLLEVLKKIVDDLLPGISLHANIDQTVPLYYNLLTTWNTAKVAFVGLSIAIVAGMIVAVLMSQASWVERSLFPYLIALQAVPILAIVPLISIWFGYGFNARVIVCIIIAFFPIAANTLFGLLAAEAGQHDLFTLHGASRLTRLRKLQFPAALPVIFTGLRISAGLAVVGAIVGDIFFGRGEGGLGQALQLWTSRLRNDALFGAIILSSLLGYGVFMLFDWLRDRAIGRWHVQQGR